jgi:hypothetical protein
MAAMRSSSTEGTGALPAGPLGRSNSLLIPRMSRRDRVALWLGDIVVGGSAHILGLVAAAGAQRGKHPLRYQFFYSLLGHRNSWLL